MQRIFTFLVCFCVSNFALSQKTEQPIEPCGHNAVIEHLEKKYAGFKNAYDKQYVERVNLTRKKQVNNRKKQIRYTSYKYDTIYTVKVVFHVLYSSAFENVEDSLIYNQIEVLNEDFRKLNSDTSNIRDVFKPRAGDARINFVLADKDPKGNPTTGINKVPTTVTSWGTQQGVNNNMKYSSRSGADAWDPSKYINVWVCDLSFNNQDQLLGFAYPPYGHPFWQSNSFSADPEQGVVIHYKCIGRNNRRATSAVLQLANKGRVATHEFGHYFGLRHIWADDQFLTNKCLMDDYIDDTPLQGTGSNFNCDRNRNTCIEASTDFPDMVENYMDYSTHQCQTMFTQGQTSVMYDALKVFRKDLIVNTVIEVDSQIIDSTLYDQMLIFYRTDKQEVVVELPSEQVSAHWEFSLFNSIGQRMINQQKVIKNETLFDVRNLSPGIYIGVLYNSEGETKKTVRFVVD